MIFKDCLQHSVALFSCSSIRTIDFVRMVQISEWNNERALRRVDPEAEDYELI
jgi:hypothetical protein